MERDDEIKGGGNEYTTDFRQYDPRLGRWTSPDALMMLFAGESPYNFVFNNPIVAVDPLGLAPERRGPDNPKGNNAITRATRWIRSNIKMLGDRLSGNRDPRGVISVRSNGQQGSYEAKRWGTSPAPGNIDPQQAELVIPDIDPEPGNDPHEWPTFEPKEIEGRGFEIPRPVLRPVPVPQPNPIIPPLPCVPQNFNLTFNWIADRAQPQNNAFAMNQLQRIANQWLGCNNYTQVTVTVNTPAPQAWQFLNNGATGNTFNNLMFNRAQWIQNRLMGLGIPAGAFINAIGNRRLNINWGVAGGPASTVNIR